MKKHTSGPWNLSKPFDWKGSKTIQVFQRQGRDGDKVVTLITYSDEPHFKDDKEESIANAHLIAAAPEMFEALKQVELYARVNHDKPKDFGELVARAIAKAEGK